MTAAAWGPDWPNLTLEAELADGAELLAEARAEAEAQHLADEVEAGGSVSDRLRAHDQDLADLVAVWDHLPASHQAAVGRLAPMLAEILAELALRL